MLDYFDVESTMCVCVGVDAFMYIRYYYAHRYLLISFSKNIGGFFFVTSDNLMLFFSMPTSLVKISLYSSIE